MAVAGTDAGVALRAWQLRVLASMDRWESGSFLMSAAPGAGKTLPALVFACALLERGEIDRVALICPTSPLTRQWTAAAHALGLSLEPDAASLATTRDFHGIAVTYARVAMDPAAYGRGCSPRTLVIADETHHLGEDLAWGRAFELAFSVSRRRLLLSGTPFRSDQNEIPGVRYDDDGLARPDFSYGYDEAIADGVCRPVTFVAYDGMLRWQDGDDVLEASFDDALSGRAASRRYRTAISTELDGLPRMLEAAHERLMTIRADGHSDAGGLVVAADTEHARAIASLLREVTGESPVIVLHTEAQAGLKLERFRSDRRRWLVAVNMVSEGVDIPRLRVGVYATAAKTPLMFRQIVGRFVRTQGAAAGERSWLFLPGDPVLRRHAADVQEDLRHALDRRNAQEEIDVEFDDSSARLRDGPDAPPTWMPVSADVAPQMTLFAGPAAAEASSSLHRIPRPPSTGSTTQGHTHSAHRRRSDLRAERHGLVSELSRISGRSHREINAEVNRAAGVSRVGQATIEQLEKSTRFLSDAIHKSSRRRGSRR